MANENCKQVTTPVTDNTPLDCPVFVKDKCVILPTGSSFLLTDDDDSLEEYHIALEEKLILMNNTISTKEDSLGNPPADGYVLTSTATGVRSWSSVAGGSAHTIRDEGSDLPQRTYLNFVGTGVTATDDSGTNTTTITIASGGLNNIVEDTTPQLGGNLDLNGNVITGLEIGTDVQAYSPVLQNTTASFTTTLLTKLNGIEPNAKDDQSASEVPFTPYLTITSTNIQSAVQELKDELDSVSVGGLADGDKGDITVSGGGSTWTIDNAAITTSKISDGSVVNAKLPANGILFNRLEEIAQSTILGRASGAGTGDITALTPAQIRTIINVENGATGDQTATEVPIADAGGYFTTNNVEAAFQQLGAILADGDKGDITITAGVWTIDDNAIGTTKIADNNVTTTKLQQIAPTRLLGNASGATANVDELTPAEVRAMLNVEDGATASDARSYVDSTSNGLTGLQNSTNTTFTVSEGSYLPGSLIVFIGGYPMSAGQGITETTPGSGIFDFDLAPESTDIIIAQYSN